MKANKALKRLSKMETQISDLTKRYSASAPHIGELLEDVKAAVVRAKDAVRNEVAAGESSKKPAKKHSKAESKTKVQAQEKAAAAPKKAAKKAAAKSANAKAEKNAAPSKKAVKKVAKKKIASPRPSAAMAAVARESQPFTMDNLDAPSSR